MSEIKTSELLNSLDSELEHSPKLKDKFSAFMKKSIYFIRRLFAMSNEKSLVASFIEMFYSAILTCRSRVIATFILSFSVVSFIFGYIINTSINFFVADINTFYSVIAFLLGLLLMTSRAPVYELIANSKVLSKLSLIYNQQFSFIKSSNRFKSFEINYSTAFFVGIITGIFSAAYSVSAILAFIVCLTFVIFILNRPECGLLTTHFLIPIIDINILIAFTIVTFISFFYKFLIGKRHFDFGVTEILIFLCIVYVLSRSVGDINEDNIKIIICHITFYLCILFSVNLIRTTAMFRRVLSIVIRMTHIYAVLMIANFVSRLFFSGEKINSYLTVLDLNHITSALYDYNFIIPFLVFAIPLNLATVITAHKKQDFAVNIFFTATLSLCACLVASYHYILIIMLSCTAILFTFKKRFGLLFIPSPFIAYAVTKVLQTSSYAYNVTQRFGLSQDAAASVAEFRKPLLLGRGFTGSFTADIVILQNNSTVDNFIFRVGIAGFILMFLLMLVMIIRAFRSLSKSKISADKARILSSSLLVSVLSFLSVCFFNNTLSDFRIVYLFAVVLSLSSSAVKCYEADYIDKSTVREYIG